MKLNFINILVLLIFFSCTAQENDLIVNKNGDEAIVGNEDEKGNKTGSWVFYNSSKKVKKILNYKDGFLEGYSYLFFDNGNVDKRMIFKNGRLNGEVKFYSKEGELLAVYIYHNDIIKEVKSYILNKESPPRNHDYVPEWK
ncbi:hypothetical protein HSX10_07335 [Winogradskyella undariae]|uniref:toxin-antitoxin system YwqK family antitoxin n=1 Tax=Winogradskyella undariae TaxID=1285465 RepID=UPI00156BB0CD|nr:hypothetical protein [Winogradskyella undariae]NRR91373.1 hypothetical protein [Winogradskyella undariae]